MENPDEHFNNVEFVNFNIIHSRCASNPLKNYFQNYKTIEDDNFKYYPEQKKKRKRFHLQ